MTVSLPPHTADDLLDAGQLLLAALAGDLDSAHTLAAAAHRCGRDTQLATATGELIAAIRGVHPLRLALIARRSRDGLAASPGSRSRSIRLTGRDVATQRRLRRKMTMCTPMHSPTCWRPASRVRSVDAAPSFSTRPPRAEPRRRRDWLLGWRDITHATNEHTFVPSVLPKSAVGHVFPLAYPSNPVDGCSLHAVWSSLIFDYVARQKISGIHMTYTVLNQIACPAPSTFEQPTPWQPKRTVHGWLRPYVIELAYTSWRLKPYADELGDDGPPFRWEPERRALLRADLMQASFTSTA